MDLLLSGYGSEFFLMFANVPRVCVGRFINEKIKYNE